MNIVNLFFVANNISFINKSLLTNVTFMRSVVLVHHFNMSFEVALHPKGLGTLFTLVKSLLCVMRFKVVIESTFLCKAFVTFVTLEFTFPLAMSNYHVSIKESFVLFWLSTYVTNKIIDFVVDMLLMLFQSLQCRRNKSTYFTNMLNKLVINCNVLP